MASLRRTRIEVHTQRRILGTAELPMLICVPESIIRLRVPQVCRLREQLCGVRVIAEDVIAVARFVQETELERRRIVLEVCALGRAFEPFQTFAVAVPKAHVADHACAPETGCCARMVLGGGLPIELNGFLEVFASAPAKFIAEGGAVAGFGMAVFAGGDEEGKCAVIIFVTLAEKPRCVAVGEIVLGKWVAAVGKSLEDMTRFAEELGLGANLTLFACRYFLGGVDHENSELVLDCRVVGFLDIRAVHVKGFLGAEKGSIIAHSIAELSIVEVCGRWWRLRVGDVKQIDVGDWPAIGRRTPGEVIRRVLR